MPITPGETLLFLHPLTFQESLDAVGEEALNGIVDRAGPGYPVGEPFHRRFVDYARTFQLIGGMPAVVDAYARQRDLPACFKILDARRRS